MKNANQILSSKGYDFNEQNDIINFKTKFSENGLDMKVREEFGLQDEPLHLWESYYIGDADEDNLKAQALKLEYKEGNISEMLTAMDRRLIELCCEIENKTV